MSENYAKVFGTMFTGSMYGAGLHVFATWAWILTHKDESGLVEVNARLVAAELGTDVQQIERAIEYLTAADPGSRSPEEEGRRMVRVGQFSYQVVNHAKYADRGRDRSAYWRDYRAKRRATVAQQPAQVAQRKFTHVDVDVDVEKKERSSTKSATPAQQKRFAAPTPEEVDAYAKSIGFALDAEAFCDYYGTRGWKIGNASMKDWKAAVRTWKRRDAERKAAEPDPAEGMSRLFSEEEADDILARLGRPR